MACLRRYLRSLTAAWLFWQIATLSAVIPADCCAGHRPAQDHSRSDTTAVHCPMKAAAGSQCPMHRRASGADTEHAYHATTPPPAPTAECRLVGTCPGPLAALIVVISNHAVLPVTAGLSPAFGAFDTFGPLYERPIGQWAPPDSPPPRL